MYTGKADRNAVYKTHKFFNRECKKGRSLFFLSVISAAAILAGTVLTGCRRADDLVQEQAEPENYALTVFTAQERKEWEPVIKEFEERTGCKGRNRLCKGDAFPAGKRRGRLGCGLWGQCGRLRGRQRVLADRQRCLDRVFSGILCDFI